MFISLQIYKLFEKKIIYNNFYWTEQADKAQTHTNRIRSNPQLWASVEFYNPHIHKGTGMNHQA